jgi:hypothetical protein
MSHGVLRVLPRMSAPPGDLWFAHVTRNATIGSTFIARRAGK